MADTNEFHVRSSSAPKGQPYASRRYPQIIEPRRGGTHLHPTRVAPLGLCGVRVTVTQAVGLGWHRAAPSGRNTNMEFDSVSKIGTARRASRTCRLSGAECVVRPGLETLPISVGRTHQQALTCRTRIGTPMSFGRAFIPTGAKSKCHSLRKFLSHDFGSEFCSLSPSQLPS